MNTEKPKDWMPRNLARLVFVTVALLCGIVPFTSEAVNPDKIQVMLQLGILSALLANYLKLPQPF
jgi:hypothetical protein